jgi:hypothetical protein
VFANFHANTNTNARPTAEHGDDETQPAADMKSGRRKRLAQRPAREMQAPRNTGRR